jgi:hypothetical protein
MKSQWQLLNEHPKNLRVIKYNNNYYVVAAPEVIRGPDIPMYIITFDGNEYPYGYLEL